MSRTSAAVIVQDQRESVALEDMKQDLIANAVGVFSGDSDLSRYYHNVRPSRHFNTPVRSLSSEEAKDQLQSRLEQTIEARQKKLEKLVEELDRTDTIRQGAQSKSVVRNCQQVGSRRHPGTTFLYDGSSWSRGSPLISQEHINEIKDHAGEENLYLVELTLTH